MNKSVTILCGLFLVLVTVSLLGCAGSPQGRMPRVNSPTENELKQDWKNYTVYYRPHTALIYKLKDDRKIILDPSWVEVTTDEMMVKSKIVDSSWVKQIAGLNDAVYGYLVHRAADRTSVAIIDENTVRLYYHYIRTSGGP